MITSLSDWFKVLAPFFQPIRNETKTNCGLRVHIFLRFVSATSNYFEFWLVYWIVSVLFDWPKQLLRFWFYDTIENCSKSDVQLLQGQLIITLENTVTITGTREALTGTVTLLLCKPLQSGTTIQAGRWLTFIDCVMLLPLKKNLKKKKNVCLDNCTPFIK